MIRSRPDGTVVLQACDFPEVVVRPFPDFSGPLHVRETPTTFQVSDGQRLVYYHRFVRGCPEAHRGTRPVFPADLDDTIVLGRGFPLVVTAETGTPKGAWLGDLVWRVHELLRSCGVQVRTTRPPLTPGDYGTVHVVSGPLWKPELTGLTADRFPTTRQPDGFTPRVCTVRANVNPVLTAGIVVHECLHAWGLDHTDPAKRPDDVRHSFWPPARVWPEDEAHIRTLTAPWRT